MVGERLAKRKKEGTFKGAYAPVTHFFGYQGRSSFPSLFDCSLGSAYGFGAGALVEAGLTGHAMCVRGVTGPIANWRLGGVPLFSLLKVKKKSSYGRDMLTIASEEVDMNGRAFQHVKVASKRWTTVDHYSNPGKHRPLSIVRLCRSDSVLWGGQGLREQEHEDASRAAQGGR